MSRFQNQAARLEIKIRATRRTGQISRGLEKAKHGGKHGGSETPRGGVSKIDVLKAAGLTTQAASRCEKIADIPEEEFESLLNECKAAGKPISEKELLSKVVVAFDLLAQCLTSLAVTQANIRYLSPT